MNEITNAQVSWEIILKKQIDSLDKIYQVNNSIEFYKPLIERLNNNQLPSKIYMRDGKSLCYGYMIPQADAPDRILCSMGFDSEDQKLIEVGKDILLWFVNTAKEQKKLLILDGIFNGNFFSGIVKSTGFVSAKRQKLISDLNVLIDNIREKKGPQLASGDLVLRIDEVDLEELCTAEDIAYQDSPDKFLLIREGGKNKTPEILLKGTYGMTLNAASCILYGEGIMGMIQVTDGTMEIFNSGVPLIVDIFVTPQYRRKGVGSKLLLYAAEKLKVLGHSMVQLWVNENSIAYNFYQSIGFTSTMEDDLILYNDFRMAF